MNYSLYEGDCLIEMDKLQDNSVDMILCDLPYGMTSCKWDCVIPFDKLWESYKEYVKRMLQFYYLVQSHLAHILDLVILSGLSMIGFGIRIQVVDLQQQNQD